MLLVCNLLFSTAVLCNMLLLVLLSALLCNVLCTAMQCCCSLLCSAMLLLVVLSALLFSSVLFCILLCSSTLCYAVQQALLCNAVAGGAQCGVKRTRTEARHPASAYHHANNCPSHYLGHYYLCNLGKESINTGDTPEVRSNKRKK